MKGEGMVRKIIRATTVALMLGLSVFGARAQSPLSLFQNSVNSTIVPNGVGAITAAKLNATLSLLYPVFTSMGTWDPVTGLFSPTIPANFVTNQMLANVPAQTLKGAVIAGQPQDLSPSIAASLLGPFFPSKPINVSGSAQTTTANCVSGVGAVTVGNVVDFVPGQGIVLNHCGVTFSGAAPTALTVSAQNGTGSTGYCYATAAVDANGGVGAATSPVCIANGVATLGNHNSISNRSYNKVLWTPGTGSTFTALWRNTNGGTYCLLGVFTAGQVTDLNVPCNGSIWWVPSAPTPLALSDWLLTSVTAVVSPVLTLSASPATTTSGAYVQHDDTSALNVAMVSPAKSLSLPAGTYNVTSLSPPSNIVGIMGVGRDLTNIVGIGQVATGLGASGIAETWTTVLPSSSIKQVSGLSISPTAAMAVGGMTVLNASYPVYSLDRFSGAHGLFVFGNTNALIKDNLITNWWGYGIDVDAGQNNQVLNNRISGLGGEAGGFYVAIPGLYAIGIQSQDGAQNTLISGNHIVMFGGVFGISNQGPSGVVTGNYIACTTHEGIAAAGQMASNSFVSSNYIVYFGGGSTASSTPSQCTSDDYGMSVEDDGTHSLFNVAITNNYIQGSLFAAIDILTSGASGVTLQFTTISNNTISNSASGSVAAILVEGALTSFTTIGTNNFQFNPSQYDVGEGSTNGTPASTIVALQAGRAAATGTVKLLSTNSIYATKPTSVAGPSTY